MAKISTSSLQKWSEDMNNYCCSICEEDNVSTEADVYCELCLKLYCLKCINLHSQLFKRHNVYGRDEMDKWPASKGTLDFIETCEVHRGEKLKVFCEDHRKLCCSNCVMMTHRQCTKLTLISEAANTSTRADFENLSAKLQQILVEIKELQRSHENNIVSLHTSYTERLDQLREIRNKINAQLDELEKATVKELEELKTKLNDSFKADVETCIRFEAELKSLIEALQVAENKNKELAFMAYSKCMDGINRFKTHLHEISEQKECSITFQVNSDIERYLSSLSGLGWILSNHCLITVETNKVYLDPFEKPDVKALCDFPNGNCLMAMLNTRKMVLVDPNFKVLSQCSLSARPQSMCQISPCQAAVAVEDWATIHQIQFISENKGQLVKDRTIEQDHACAGIAHHQGDIYVTSKTALYHYTINGKQITKLYEDTSGGTTVCKCAVNPTGDIIYVTNRTKHALLTLSRDGTLLSTFQDPELKMPFAIHVTALGQVLLCGVNSKTVIQVDGAGRRKVAKLASEKKGLFKPMSVYYSKNTNAIIVGQAECDYILLLKVK